MSKERRNPLEPIEDIPEVLAARARPKPKRDRSWDAGRNKATYDLPPELIQRIRDIAEELAAEYPNAKVRVSDVARLLVEAGLQQYDAGQIEVNLRPAVLRLYPD